MRHWWIGVVSLVLAGCTVAPSPLDQLSKGINGFTGQVEPVRTPIMLRYTPVHIEQRMETRLRVIGDKPQDRSIGLVMVTKGFAIERGIRVDASVNEMITDGQIIRPALPIIRVTGLMSDVGRLSDVEVEFPALPSDKQPKKGSKEYNDLVRSMNYAPTLLAGPYSSGQTVYRMSLKDMVPDLRFDSDGVIDATLLGISTVKGRRAAVVLLDGTLSITERGETFSIRAKGYSALDLRTAMPIDGVTLITIDAKDGRNTVRLEAFSKADATIFDPR